MLPVGIPEIEEKYELLAKMGEGGMGAVYKARHKLLEEERVIKIIRPQLRQDEDLQLRFLREARVAAKMRHPHIATLHDFAFAGDGLAFIVMDFIDGQNLRQYQRDGGRLSLEQVVEVADQALGALGYLHDRGFVHRDIASDNLMIGWRGDEPRVTLIDLGLAKSLESNDWRTRTGMVVGKVRYISPEQLNSGQDGVVVDGRSDLYSFGVVLYELLTGELPIVGTDDVSLIAGHLYRAPRPFSETDPRSQVSEPLRRVALRALEKDPERRWQTAAEFASHLRQALNQHRTRDVGSPSAAAKGAAPPVNQVDLRIDGDEPTRTIDVAEAHRTQPAGTAVERIPVASATERATVAVEDPNPADASAREATGNSPLAPALDPADPLTRAVVAPEAKSPKLFAVLLAGAVLIGLILYFLTRGGALPAEPPAAPLFFGDFHALVIGNNDYESLPDLRTAVADARAVASVLEDEYGFTVELLIDADRDTLVSALDALSQRLTSRDNLLVYYAGHGQLQNLTEYWQPVDADPTRSENWIHTRYELVPLLDQIEARHVLVVADSCFAGTSGLAPPPTPPQNREEIRDRLARSSRMVLSSGSLQPVLDGGGALHSVFARAFLDALEMQSASDEPLATSTLFARLEPTVAAAAERLDFEQRPVLAPLGSAKDAGGELYFVPGGGAPSETGLLESGSLESGSFESGSLGAAASSASSSR